MRRKENASEDRPAATLAARPPTVVRGKVLLLDGEGWPLDALTIVLAGKPRVPARVLAGTQWNAEVVPTPLGGILVEVSTEELEPGEYTVRAQSRAGVRAEARFRVAGRSEPGDDAPRERRDKPFMRDRAFKYERTHGRPWPKGFALAMRRDWIEKYGPRRREETPGGGSFFTAPIPGGCNWVPLGPAPFVNGPMSVHGNNSGRTRCLAIDPLTPSRMYAGTASGGVWKSTDAGVTWVPKTDDKFSLAIGALAVDPVTPAIVYAGTGELVPGSDAGAYYGRGLLRSADFGETWTEIGVAEFDLAEIARIVVNPLDPANLFVAASNGLWEGTLSGAAWTQLSPDPCTDVVLVQKPTEMGTRRLVAAFSGIGIRGSANSGAGWSAFAGVAVPGAPASPARVVFGVCRTMPQVMYAAFADAGGNMLAHVARSDDWGAAWAARAIPLTGFLYQAGYNLAIQPHPTTPDTVLLDVVDVFKSTNGGNDWTAVSLTSGPRVHADCHAVAWHPTDASRLFVACDGGVFFTPSLSATWEARNLDLSTLQLYDLGQHPVYEAILIAGSQDNGGFHHSGAPIWRRTWVRPGVVHNSMDGDAVVAQIDPFDGYVHYYGTGPEATTRRSDDAGKLFPTAWAATPGTQWWIPFAPDPRTPGVVFTGGTRLRRSQDRGTSWGDVTNDLAGSVRSLGFHPADALVLYVGTTTGHVYRVTGPALGAWTPGSVTTEDVTFTGLPANIGISSLAVDAFGNVWATSSDLMHAEGTGEFLNHHVFRLDAGAMAWATKSDGLVVANPVNTIVIDPADSTRVFCGADRGVFRWNAGPQNWTPLDQGLPNAPIMKLLVHAPSRRLRAATYGRGVWERPLDEIGCSDHFLYLRDNLVDSGRTPSPDGVAHPYVAGTLCWHWQSQDIVVDSINQTPAIVTSAIELYDRVLHVGAQRGANRVYVTVHNRGPFAVTDVRVRAFFADATLGLPAFPAGLLTDPFGWNPAGPVAWNPVSVTSFGIARIEPGTTRLAYWPFTIPMSAARHSCLLAFVTSTQDPFASGGITNPDELVVNNRKVALRNLDLDAMPGSEAAGRGGGGGGGGGSMPGAVSRELRLRGHDRHESLARVVVYCGNLPEDALIVAAVDRRSRKRFAADRAKLSRRAEKVRDELVRRAREAKELEAYDVANAIVRKAGPRMRVAIGETPVDRDRSVGMIVWIHSEQWDRDKTYSVDVVQMQGEKVRGGYTIQLVDFERMLKPAPGTVISLKKG